MPTGAGAGDSQAVVHTHICSTLPLLPPSSLRLSPSLLLPVCFFLHFCLFLQFIFTLANTVVVWDAKRQLFLQKVSSKLGPSIREQDRGLRPEQEPSGQGSGVTGQEISRPLSDGPTPRQGVSLRRTRQSQIQSLGMLLFPQCARMKTI